jgi:hypothetical protein
MNTYTRNSTGEHLTLIGKHPDAGNVYLTSQGSYVQLHDDSVTKHNWLDTLTKGDIVQYSFSDDWAYAQYISHDDNIVELSCYASATPTFIKPHDEVRPDA